MINIWLVVLLLMSTLLSRRWNQVQSFTPMAAPRFDVFAENIIGTWSVIASPEGTTNGKEQVIQRKAQEVMRSCGGAVQGIREVPTKTEASAEEDGIYLNRANDGFLFYQDGSYTIGPTQLDRDGENPFLFCFPCPGNSRVLIEMHVRIINDKIDAKTQTFYLSKQSTASPLTKGIDSTVQLLGRTVEPIWNKELRCRMPSASFPWSLQRAKWECREMHCTNENDEESTSHLQMISDNPSFYYWIDTGCPDNDGSHSAVGCAMVQCHSGLSIGFVRLYDPMGKLVMVAQKYGFWNPNSAEI